MEFINLIIDAVITGVALTIALLFHEIAHGYTALLLGDNTAKYQHRLSFNPLRHINPKFALIVFIGILVGNLVPFLRSISSIILWVGFVLLLKPVPINPNYFKDPKKGMALTALMGPVTNLTIAFVGLFLFVYLHKIQYVREFLVTLIMINIQLAVFNFIPVPPLDGSRVLFAFLPTRYYFQFMQYERYIMIGFLALVWFGAFDIIIRVGVNNIFNLFASVVSMITGVPIN